MGELRAVPKPTRGTVKKCTECNWKDFVPVRKKNCPECGMRGSLEVVPGALKKMRERPCECGCGQTVVAPRRFVSGHNARVPGHIYRNGRAYKKIKCYECKGKFERRIDQINRHGLRNFCSRECYGKYSSRISKGRIIKKTRRGIYKKCKGCGQKFYVKRSILKKGYGKFCSRKCYDDWIKAKGLVPKGFISSVNNAGKNNGMYKHGKRIGGHISKKQIREQVIDRDGNWCLLCGKPGPGLHLHRIVYGSQGGKYEINNCILLCPIHHDQVHSSKKQWEPVLKKYIQKRQRSWDDTELWKIV